MAPVASAPGKATKRRKVAATVADAGPPPADNIPAIHDPGGAVGFARRQQGLAAHARLGEKATAIWVKSREYHGIPAPFEGFTERTWAQFIFGRICQDCGENESREPDFGLMMRLCAECRRDNLCQDIDFSKESDEEEDDPLFEFEDFFPHSYWYESRDEILCEDYRSRYITERFWWEPYCWDILAVVRQANRGHKGAEKKLAKLCAEGERRLEHGRICDKWREEVEAEECRTKIEALTSKFKALGYQDPELNGLDDYKMLAQFNIPLTEHAWEDMRGKLEGSIKDKRRKRLVQEHPDIMNGRLILAREAYVAYVRTVSPTEATYVPTIAGLEDIPGIRAICEREPEVEVTGGDFSNISSILANWVSDKRMRLTELVNNNDTAPGKAGRSNFDLASTIFRCKIEHEKLGRPAMFGGDEAMQHVGESCDPELDIPLSTLASTLVVSLGLDPDITTVADMDRHAARFRCEGRVNYSDCGKGNRHTMHVFTWRGCVTHAISAHQYGAKTESLSWRGGPDKYYKNGTVNFVAVPEDVAARAVGPCHDDVPKAASTSWVCGHCTKYAGGPEQLQGVTAHVKTVHGKAQPDGLDILLAPGVLSINGSYSITRPGAPVANSRKAKVLFRGEEVGRRAAWAWALVGRRTIMEPFAVSDAKNPRGDSLGWVPHKIVNAVCDVDYAIAA
ncbi:hypothetical protein B0H13DRAFT_2486403 [Mycena leptocephala]|nr:hypothetical protein B0H13DRAFT_2486403 [Mycena leptocephala]